MDELHKLLPNMTTAGSTVYNYSSRILPAEKEKQTTTFLYYYYYYYYYIYHLYAQGVWNYICETNHVSRVYIVAAILYLQFMYKQCYFPCLLLLLHILS